MRVLLRRVSFSMSFRRRFTTFEDRSVANKRRGVVPLAFVVSLDSPQDLGTFNGDMIRLRRVSSEAFPRNSKNASYDKCGALHRRTHPSSAAPPHAAAMIVPAHIEQGERVV